MGWGMKGLCQGGGGGGHGDALLDPPPQEVLVIQLRQRTAGPKVTSSLGKPIATWSVWG